MKDRGHDTRWITVVDSKGSEIARRVQVAATFRARAVGLLGRKRLQTDEGMLFRPGGSIHTLGMRTDIDVAFLDRDYRVLKVSATVRPWRMRFAPAGTFYTLEVAPGRLARNGLHAGERLTMVSMPREK
jgi:uncharacterized protein